MQIIEVIPIQHLPKTVSQVLTYYHKSPISKGAIVEINVNHRNILAIVTNSEPIENLKSTLKSNTFSLKKISKIVYEKSIVNDSFWEISKFISTYYYDDLTRVIKILLNSSLDSLIKYLQKQKDPIFDFKPIEIKENIPNWQKQIIETYNSQQSVFLAFPTKAELLFHLNILKTILPETAISVLDKKTTTKEKNKIYFENLNQKPQIIFGLRKSISLLTNITKLIIVFNSNDPSYKSWDLRPYYNFETVLKWYALKNKINILFEKDNFETTYIKTLNKTKIDNIFAQKEETNPKVEIIISNSYNRKEPMSFLFKKDIFKQKENKWILFLNKKGYKSSIKCKDCGYIFNCDSCDRPLTLFRENIKNTFICNYCQKKIQANSTCPKCKGSDFVPLNFGLDKLNEDLLIYFKDLNIPVFQIEAETNEQINLKKIEDFNNEKTAILIGTEAMLIPQLNSVSNVGVINLDYLFSIPDFKTEEKVLKLLSKLKNLATKTLTIQTGLKHNETFQYLRENNLEDFWKLEFKLRKRFLLPPFSQIIKIKNKDKNPLLGLSSITKIYQKIEKTIQNNKLENIFTLTPVKENFIEKLNNFYQFNFLLKMKIDEDLTIKPNQIKMRNQLLKLIPEDFYIDVDPLDSI